MMNLLQIGTTVLFCLSLGGCVRDIFPPDVMQGVPPTFDFKAWRQATSGHGGLKVQVGGRIVQSEQTSNGVLIVAEQLPIVTHPAYGPTDTGKRVGEFEFAFLFKGKLSQRALFPGNRFIMVGTTQGKQETVLVDGAPKSEPYLIAHCVHIWNTEGREIADFVSGDVGGGFTPLEENTYCEEKKK
jgi:starvation-inducible outer membrane lipoprotein